EGSYYFLARRTSVDRRKFLVSSSGATLASVYPKTSSSLFSFPPSVTWRSFVIVTRVEVLEPTGVTRIWVPTGLIREAPYQRTFANDVHADGGTAKLVQSKPDGLGIVVAEFPSGAKPVVTVTTKIRTRDFRVDLGQAGELERPAPAELE